MSFRTKVVILGGLFVALLAALIVGGIVMPRGVSQRSAAQVLLPGFRIGDAVKIVESDSIQSLVLEKSGSWWIDFSGRQFPASSARVDGASECRCIAPARNPRHARCRRGRDPWHWRCDDPAHHDQRSGGERPVHAEHRKGGTRWKPQLS